MVSSSGSPEQTLEPPTQSYQKGSKYHEEHRPQPRRRPRPHRSNRQLIRQGPDILDRDVRNLHHQQDQRSPSPTLRPQRSEWMRP